MKTITIADIRNLNPCYDPTKFLPEDWSGTILDVLGMEQVSAKDRLWVAVRAEFLTDMEIKLFGLKVARRVQGNSPDKRVAETLDVVERYLNGMSTREELDAARSAAGSAAFAAESAAAFAAFAAESAAKSAAMSAAAFAAESAAKSAAAFAAGSAAFAAESAAAFAAWSAAESAAWFAAKSAEEEGQVQILIEILRSIGAE